MGKRRSKAPSTSVGDADPAAGRSSSGGSRSVWSSLPWKKASTSVNSNNADADADDADAADTSAQRPAADLGYNHYDDPTATADDRFEGELYDATPEGGGRRNGGNRRQKSAPAVAGAAVMDGADDPGILFGF